MLLGFLALLLGILALYSDTVFVYEKAKGLYSVSKIVDSSRYWVFTVMYFHGFLFCLFVAAKRYYPIRLRELMQFDSTTHLSVYQVVFILLVAALFYGSSFYVSDLISGA